MPIPIPVTVIVPVKNEEANLNRCLEALSSFTEIVVVDSGSADATCEIAKAHGATILQFSWDGGYPKKRNWVLSTYTFQTEWVMFVDADEVVTPQFCGELSAKILDGDCSAYWLNFTTFFLERELRFGVPQRKLALFRVASGKYERIEESFWSELDMEVHEHPIVQGKAGAIHAKIEHRDFRGLAHFISRHMEYAKWEAHRYRAIHAEGLSGRSFTKRQKFKYRYIRAWWYAWFYFAFTYIVRMGFLDGRAGFWYAMYKAWYFYTIRLLILSGGEEYAPQPR